jgi:hypothetical protein
MVGFGQSSFMRRSVQMITFPELGLQFELSDLFCRGVLNDTLCIALRDGSAGWLLQRIPAALDNGSLAELCRLAKQVAPVGNFAGILEQDDEPRLFGYALNPHTQDLLFCAAFKSRQSDTERKKVCTTILASLQWISPMMAEWDKTLRGKRLVAVDIYRRAYGSGDGYSAEEQYRFRTDGAFEQIRSSHISVSGLPDMSASRTSQEKRVGLWSIAEVNRELRLLLEDNQGKTTSHRLARQTGKVLLDGVAFTVGVA